MYGNSDLKNHIMHTQHLCSTSCFSDIISYLTQNLISIRCICYTVCQGSWLSVIKIAFGNK